MARARHDIRVDLSGVDLAALRTDDDVRREARRLLPAALEELGQALGEAAWERQQATDGAPAVQYRGADGMREFVLKAGRTYRRFAPAPDREALESLIVQRLLAARIPASADTKDEPSPPDPPGPGTGAADADPAPPAAPGCPTSRPASVLVIEDNTDAADSLARFLRLATGYEVKVAYDGAAGAELAAADRPTAVVCDLGLPRLNGLQVAGRLAGLGAARPLLIAVTALSGTFPEAQARAAGFDHFLVKPADPFAIEALIGAHVRPGADGPAAPG
jgi:CheY-like chemotaxis protein